MDVKYFGMDQCSYLSDLSTTCTSLFPCFIHLFTFYFSDLYMLHWPDSMQPGRSNRELRAEAWRALEELYKEGIHTSVVINLGFSANYYYF